MDKGSKNVRALQLQISNANLFTKDLETWTKHFETMLNISIPQVKDLQSTERNRVLESKEITIEEVETSLKYLEENKAPKIFKVNCIRAENIFNKINGSRILSSE